MKNTMITREQISMVTGEAMQGDASFNIEPERDQYYFEMQQEDNRFFVGLKDMLIGLKILENLGEIPKINEEWWLEISTHYGKEILMTNFEDEESL